MGIGENDEARPSRNRAAQPALVKCAAHGLHFDPTTSPGCVLCRKASEAPSAVSPRIRWWPIAVAWLALTATSIAAWRHHRSVAAAAPSASTTASGASLFDPRLQNRRRNFDPRDPIAAQRQAREREAKAAVDAAMSRIDAESQTCEAGNAEACLSLANDCRLTSGLGGPGSLLPVLRVDVDPVRLAQARKQCRRVAPALRKLCDEGILKACEQAQASGFDSPGARERACDLGSAPACSNLAQQLRDGPVAAEAARLRAEQLLRCELEPSQPCVAEARSALLSQASAALKAQARDKCRTGSAEDCITGANTYQRGPMEDLALSAELRQTACNRGSDDACMALSKLLAEGRGLPRDERRALELHDKYMKRALDEIDKCKSGLDCAYLKMIVAKQGNVSLEVERAKISDGALIAECDAGRLLSCDALRSWYSSPSNKNASASLASAYGQKANALSEHACQAGDTSQCIMLGAHLLDLPPLDRERGQRLLDSTCTSGSYEACWFLGERTHLGHNKNSAQSAAYYQRAILLAEPRCDAGDANACYVLASGYTVGKGVPEDEKKAMGYLEKMHTPTEP